MGNMTDVAENLATTIALHQTSFQSLLKCVLLVRVGKPTRSFYYIAMYITCDFVYKKKSQNVTLIFFPSTLKLTDLFLFNFIPKASLIFA